MDEAKDFEKGNVKRVDNYDDVLSNTGVDLKEETYNILKENEILGIRQPSSIFQPDRTKIQDFVDQRKLSASLLSIAIKHDLKNMHPDCLTYLALATEERIKNLLEAMIAAKNHRIESENIKIPESKENNNLPIYKQLVSDAKSQLFALEKVEQEEERKRRELLFGPEVTENKEMNESVGPSTPQPKRKRQKKDSSANSALQRLTNEAIATKITNQTALVAAGGLTKSWMIAAAEELTPTIPPLPNVKTLNATSVNTSAATTTTTSSNRQSRSRSLSVSSKQQKRDLNIAFGGDTDDSSNLSVTIKDALFVLERDHSSGDAASTRDVLLKGYIKWLR